MGQARSSHIRSELRREAARRHSFRSSRRYPKHDILCAGFPCQPFSIAGVSKKLSLGKKHGFDDEKQGNLFFEIANIIEYHKPDAFVLENVKHLKRHDSGRTYEIIPTTLRGALQLRPLKDCRAVLRKKRRIWKHCVLWKIQCDSFV